MNADDPRHGTTRGYMAGCRSACCRAARAKHENMRRLAASRGKPYTVNPIGSLRRVEALMRIGWRGIDIANAAGWKTGEAVTNTLRNRRFINHRTATRIQRAYDQLSMMPGPSLQTRRRAEAKGWPPPLAWDDETIDDPTARPAGVSGSGRPRKTDVDEMAVERFVDGDYSIHLTMAERAEVARRLRAAGQSDRWIEHNTGIRVDRYLPAQREQVAA